MYHRTTLKHQTTMTTDHPTEQSLAAKPPKKPKWYWNVFWAILLLWMFGGLNTLLLQDIPMLLFLLAVGFALIYPIEKWSPQPERPKNLRGVLKNLTNLKNLLVALAGMAWILCVLAVTFALLLFVIPPFAISPQTTYLTEPRSTKFYGIDYQSVIEQQLDPGVPPEENGFRLLAETFGRPFFGENFRDEHWHRFCRYLDLPTDIEPALTFTWWEVYETTLEPEEREIMKSSSANTRLPLSEEAIPIVQRWLDENDVALDLFVAASYKSALYIPPMFDGILLNTKLTNEYNWRKIVRNLQMRVRYRLAIGEIDKAWDDVLAMHRLGELHRRTVWSLITSLINTAIVSGANHSAESVLLHSDWTSEEIFRRAEEIMPFQQPWREEGIRSILRVERFIALDALTHMANGTFGFDALSGSGQSSDLQCCPRPGTNSWFGAINEMRFLRLGIVMEMVNQRFDEFELWYFSDGMELDYEDYSTSLFLKNVVWYGYFGAIPRLIGQAMADLLTPAVEAWRTSHQRQEAEVSLMRLMFALEAYHRDNGEYPAALDDLLGHYIDEIPLDPFASNPAGEAFRYILEEPGFLLYSVGPNGVDEEGRGNNDVPKGDDIRRRVPLTHVP